MRVFYFKTFFLTWETPPSLRKLKNPRKQWGTESQMKNENQNKQIKINKNKEVNPI